MKDYSREIIVNTGQGIFCEFRSLKKVEYKRSLFLSKVLLDLINGFRINSILKCVFNFRLCVSASVKQHPNVNKEMSSVNVNGYMT